jgi:hypothetical protein
MMSSIICRNLKVSDGGAAKCVNFFYTLSIIEVLLERYLEAGSTSVFRTKADKILVSTEPLTALFSNLEQDKLSKAVVLMKSRQWIKKKKQPHNLYPSLNCFHFHLIEEM